MQPPASLKALGDPIYEAFYGLKEQPFAITTDPRFFYLSASHQRAFSELLNGLRRRESLMLLLGDTGAGKTTLCRAAIDALGDRTFAAMVLNPYMSGAEVLRLVLRDFGLVSHDDLRRGSLAQADITQLLDTLEGFLRSLPGLGSQAIIVVDEAQALSPQTLDQIRLLTDLEHRGDRLVQVVLCGQPSLLRTLEHEALYSLNERITRRVEIGPLPAEEVEDYIQHRLHVAGGVDQVAFDEAAARMIGDMARGIPRRINVLCDRALQEGRIEGANLITTDLVKRAARAVAGAHDYRPARRKARPTEAPPPAPAPAPAPPPLAVVPSPPAPEPVDLHPVPEPEPIEAPSTAFDVAALDLDAPPPASIAPSPPPEATLTTPVEFQTEASAEPETEPVEPEAESPDISMPVVTFVGEEPDPIDLPVIEEGLTPEDLPSREVTSADRAAVDARDVEPDVADPVPDVAAGQSPEAELPPPFRPVPPGRRAFGSSRPAPASGALQFVFTDTARSVPVEDVEDLDTPEADVETDAAAPREDAEATVEDVAADAIAAEPEPAAVVGRMLDAPQPAPVAYPTLSFGMSEEETQAVPAWRNRRVQGAAGLAILALGGYLAYAATAPDPAMAVPDAPPPTALVLDEPTGPLPLPNAEEIADLMAPVRRPLAATPPDAAAAPPTPVGTPPGTAAPTPAGTTPPTGTPAAGAEGDQIRWMPMPLAPPAPPADTPSQ